MPVVLLALTACGLDLAGSGPAGGATSDGGPGLPGAPAPGEGGTDIGLDAADLPDADPGPRLTVQASTPAAQVDLEAEGTLGWIHWGRTKNDPRSVNQKVSAVGAIPTFVLAGTTDLRTFEDNLTTFRWTNGAPTVIENATRNGIYAKSGTPKLTLQRIAGADAVRLVIYAGLFQAKARLTVSLVGGTGATGVVLAPATAELDVRGNGYVRYAIDYRAPDPTSDLLVAWELLTAHDANNANVTLAAATLAPMP